MAILDESPYNNHPCFSNKRENLWHRIHLPVAQKCNVKCIFCSPSVGSSCHTSKPGYAARLMPPQEAVERVILEIQKNPQLRIVAVSGPGEPLANIETFETLERVHKFRKDIHLCLSTNGTLLADHVQWLVDVGFKTLTVSMSTSSAETASKIYEWAVFGGRKYSGIQMGSKVVEEQLRGISKAAHAGLRVKVNSILIPTINEQDIIPLAKKIAKLGASLQNIIPLVPNAGLANFNPPRNSELAGLRNEAEKFIDQFRHCRQCRSDVVGIPGCDVVL
ncbi:MAG: radical SAM protein [Candidatus Thorarchaeota archaeon]